MQYYTCIQGVSGKEVENLPPCIKSRNKHFFTNNNSSQNASLRRYLDS